MHPMKDLFLFLSRQSLLQQVLCTTGPFKIVSKRFVCGETLESGISDIRLLNQAGIKVTLDHLGESVCHESEARACGDEYTAMLNRLHAEKLDATVSLKLTQMGLDISQPLCLDNLRRIMAQAKALNNKVTIDMEDTPYTDRTLTVYRMMIEEGYNGAGIVLQAYLYRSESDIKNLLPLGPRVRLCKGAYKEPKSVAFPRKKDVDKNYIHLLEMLFSKDALKKGAYPEVATHDENIINWTLEHVKHNKITPDKFEFQMLYGIRRDLQEKLVKDGYQMRVYVPYGAHWYPYFMRRLAERPANVLFLMKNILWHR